VTVTATLADLERDDRRHNWNVKRPKGAIPALTDEILDDPDWLREWLTAVLRPREGWRVVDFTHGADEDIPCALELANGQSRATYHWRSLKDLSGSAERMDRSLSAKSSGQLRPPHLSKNEHGDLIRGLCTLHPALEGQSEPDQSREWLRKVLDCTYLLEGFTLADPASQKEALAELKTVPEFTYLDAQAIARRPGEPWPRRPTALLDRETNVMGLRPLEVLAVLRHIHQIKPLRQGVLEYRWSQIGVEYRLFDPGRQLSGRHLKGWLFLVPPRTTT
jgi:hypothetical protein